MTKKKLKEILEAGNDLAAWAARAEERWSGGNLAEAVRHLAYARRRWCKVTEK